MLHSDIIPEHSCDGELAERHQTPAHVQFAWCSSCGTEFTYVPDSDWVTVVLPGMRGESTCFVVAATIVTRRLELFGIKHLAGFVSLEPLVFAYFD